MPESSFNYQNIKEFSRVNHKQINIFNCWEEEVSVTPGQTHRYWRAVCSKIAGGGSRALKNKNIQGLVTAPIHKKNIQSAGFNYTGHTPYLKQLFGVQDVCMLMVADDFRVALLSEHVPVSEAAKHVTREAILSKLNVLNQSLIKDFGIDKPKLRYWG